MKPYQGVFYFDYNSLRQAKHKAGRPSWCDFDWQGMLHDLGFKPAGEWGSNRPLRHFLVDFDWTWHGSLLGYFPVLEEPTKLFFVLGLLETTAMNNINCFIWLIGREHLDKDEVSESYENDRRIFYDCAEEFEEVKPGDNIRSWATILAKELKFRHGDFYDRAS